MLECNKECENEEKREIRNVKALKEFFENNNGNRELEYPKSVKREGNTKNAYYRKGVLYSFGSTNNDIMKGEARASAEAGSLGMVVLKHRMTDYDGGRLECKEAKYWHLERTEEAASDDESFVSMSDLSNSLYSTPSSSVFDVDVKLDFSASEALKEIQRRYIDIDCKFEEVQRDLDGLERTYERSRALLKGCEEHQTALEIRINTIKRDIICIQHELGAGSSNCTALNFADCNEKIKRDSIHDSTLLKPTILLDYLQRNIKKDITEMNQPETKFLCLIAFLVFLVSYLISET